MYAQGNVLNLRLEPSKDHTRAINWYFESFACKLCVIKPLITNHFCSIHKITF
mgnify:CR=1 FL=1